MKKISLIFCLIAILSNEAFAQDKKAIRELSAAVKAPPEKAEKVEPLSPKQFAATGFADTVEELLPTVVNISTIQEIQTNGATNVDQVLLGELPKIPLFEDFRNQLENQFRGGNGQKKKISSIGSGFIISKDGFIVTNNHVIDEASEINVSLNDGTKYKAKVIGVDRKTDLALLKINPTKDLKFVKFGDSSKARIGDWVIVIGNPYGLGGSVSVGIVSARGRDINNGQTDEFIQTDAAINKGNSGGPMFNSKGEVIGISSAIYSPSGGSVGIGFATPSLSATAVLKQLKERGEVTRGWIGISVQDVTEDIAQSMKLEKVEGAFVVDLVKDGPAEKAGILPTDVILKFDDQEITEMKLLPRTVSKSTVGESVKVVVWRQGKTKTLKVKIEKMRDEEKKSEAKVFEKKQTIKPAGQLLGLGLAELKSKIKKGKSESNLEGLVIVEINPKSEAAEKGIAIGDIILSANQTPVTSIDELKEIIDEAAKSTKKLFLFVRRGESSYALVLTATK